MQASPPLYRGYIASRPVQGSSFPQRVQNLIIRDYATRLHLNLVLSATEYAMPSCYLILEATLRELPKLGGLIFFSIFMLPTRRAKRRDIYERILATGCELHAALEHFILKSHDDIAAVEDLLDIESTLPALPLRGRYEKDEHSAEERARDPFWSVLKAAL